jgi:tRNA threonylcarbamoyladenosine biosynthesis protein TsaB
VKLLALDTSEDACSAALNLDGEILARFELAPRRHTALILPMIDGLLAEAGLVPADLDAVAFGRGPGSFTGLRIAAGVTQGIALGLDLPVLPVSTLAALSLGAYRATGAQRILAALDARMGELYCAAYQLLDGDGVRLLGREMLLKPEAVQVPEPGDWFGAGSGWGAHTEVLAQKTGLKQGQWRADLLCHAEDIARLATLDFKEGRAVAADEAIPVYLRDKVAWAR